MYVRVVVCAHCTATDFEPSKWVTIRTLSVCIQKNKINVPDADILFKYQGGFLITVTRLTSVFILGLSDATLSL